ncbi:short-chain dehydrogenase reductase sdr [Seiridium cupressi]
MESSAVIRAALTALALAVPAFYVRRKVTARSRRRDRHLKHADERVLILGASSGVGRALAKQYAARGSKVCVVARRAEEISALANECGPKCIWQVADFTKAEDMVTLRTRLEEDKDWHGLDTIQICAGVSALQPIMALTGTQSNEDATSTGIQQAVDIAGRAVQGNFNGPLVSVLTFIPMLTRTSSSPSILLVSSVAAIIPAPTRALYAATKASSLLLFQSLAIEHPKIAFTFILPATIEGNFRASAVDAGPVREADPNKHGLKIDYVAHRFHVTSPVNFVMERPTDAANAGEHGRDLESHAPTGTRRQRSSEQADSVTNRVKHHDGDEASTMNRAALPFDGNQRPGIGENISGTSAQFHIPAHGVLHDSNASQLATENRALRDQLRQMKMRLDSAETRMSRERDDLARVRRDAENRLRDAENRLRGAENRLRRFKSEVEEMKTFNIELPDDLDIEYMEFPRKEVRDVASENLNGTSRDPHLDQNLLLLPSLSWSTGKFRRQKSAIKSTLYSMELEVHGLHLNCYFDLEHDGGDNNSSIAYIKLNDLCPVCHTDEPSRVRQQVWPLGYQLYCMGAVLARLPIWIIKFGLFRSLRPHSQWTFQQALLAQFLRAMADMQSHIGISDPISLKPGAEKERFRVIRPFPNFFYKGPLESAITPTTIGGTWYPKTTSSKDIGPNGSVILHIHGGAFVIGDGRTATLGFLADTLLKHAGADAVFGLQYRLSGRGNTNPFPAGLQDVVTGYLYLTQRLGIPARNITVSGDSAGANLAIAFLRYLSEYGKELDIPDPQSAVLISPWVAPDPNPASDIAVMTNPNYHTDILTPGLMRWGAAVYSAITPVTDPYITPLGNPFATPVPIFVNQGAAEIIEIEGTRWVKEMSGVEGNTIQSEYEDAAIHDTLSLGNITGWRESAEKVAVKVGGFIKANKSISEDGHENIQGKL